MKNDPNKIEKDDSLTPAGAQMLSDLWRQKKAERRGSNLRALILAGIVVVALGTTYFLPAQETQTVIREKTVVEEKKDELAELSSISAERQLALCFGNDETAAKLKKSGACELAQALKNAVLSSAPDPQQGERGEAGEDGRGIVSTAIVDGRLRITYSDGATEDKGLIRGEKGAAGKDGRSITGSTIIDRHLLLTYSDGTTEDVGVVVGQNGVDGEKGDTGATGEQGEKGERGRGVASLSVQDGNLLVTYTDGTSAIVGPLPQGKPGEPGEPVVSWTTEHSDGSVSECRRVEDFDPEQPRYECEPASTEESSAPAIPTG